MNADRTHRGPHASLLVTLAESERGVLAALAGVVNDADRPPLLQRRIERIEHPAQRTARSPSPSPRSCG